MYSKNVLQNNDGISTDEEETMGGGLGGVPPPSKDIITVYWRQYIVAFTDVFLLYIISYNREWLSIRRRQNMRLREYSGLAQFSDLRHFNS